MSIGNEALRRAERLTELLAFAGLFLTEEHPEWLPTRRAKAQAGARVRLLLGDPYGRQLAARDSEHAIGGGVAGRVAAVLRQYRPLDGLARIRLHDDAGRVLLLRRPGNSLWTIPTGAVKKGETVREAAVRECREETDLNGAVPRVERTDPHA